MVTATQDAPAPPRTKRRRRVGWLFLAALVGVIAVLAAIWDWNWFRPLVEKQASAAIGRKVTIGHLDLRVGWNPVVILDDVTVANPDGFSDIPYFAHVDRLAVTADAVRYWHDRTVALPRIEVDRPDVNAIRLPDGRTNYALDFGSSGSDGPGVQIGELVIDDGHAHVLDPKLRGDFKLDIATRPGGSDGRGEIVVGADGTYAGQKITGQFVGGALLSLRDASQPYPVEAHLANGPTKLDLTGTVQDPLRLKGSNLKFHVSGPDLALLGPLGGIAIPRTPNYDIASDISYAEGKIRLTDLKGRVGSSDLSGVVSIDPTAVRPIIDADLTSEKVDLADLGGVIGSAPGRQSTPGQTAAQKQEVARAEASSQWLPTVPISVPQIKAVDLHMRYQGKKIVGPGMPFDSLAAVLDLVDGSIQVHPLTLGVGKGSIAGDIALAPASDKDVHVTVDMRFDRVDVGRMLAATGAVKGAGLLGGRVQLDSTGNSASTLAGRGDGSIRLMMAGGNVSALIVNLSGLQFGNAILSALGMPTRARLECFAADLAMRKGVLDTRTLLVVTDQADIVITGSLDLTREMLDYRLRTGTRHLSVGSLPADIAITGKFKNPSILPDVAELAARGGAAVALGLLLTPFGALLPTVQFGTGDENANACVVAARGNARKTQ